MVLHKNRFLQFITLDNANLSEFTDKYMFMCLVLEELVFRKYYECEEDVSIAFLRKRLYKKMSYSLLNRPVILLEMWIKDMQIMKLITLSQYEDNSEVVISRLTESGELAYQNQIYHQIYANLLAAKRSRILAVIAIFLSLFSIVLTLCVK